MRLDLIRVRTVQDWGILEVRMLEILLEFHEIGELVICETVGAPTIRTQRSLR